MRLAFVDLETTGGSPVEDRITEVGIIEVDLDEADRRALPQPIREWSALVNPDAPIPPFIETLTGITNAMVADAPRFEELADDILARLDGRLFIAHNARFDHGFLKNAFRRIGHPFRPPVLCTVRLSRRLYPGYSRHNLDTLIERHRLSVDMRHRALGDARLLWQLWQRFHDALPVDQITRAIDQLTARPSLPRHLDPDVLDTIPKTAGVYLFHGEPVGDDAGNPARDDAHSRTGEPANAGTDDGNPTNRLEHDGTDEEIRSATHVAAEPRPLYIGKGKNLRQRVMAHFTGDHLSAREMEISQQMTRIEWIETGGGTQRDLGALLTEATLVKRLMPAYNRQLRKNEDVCAWRLVVDRGRVARETIDATEAHPGSGARRPADGGDLEDGRRDDKCLEDGPGVRIDGLFETGLPGDRVDAAAVAGHAADRGTWPRHASDRTRASGRSRDKSGWKLALARPDDLFFAQDPDLYGPFVTPRQAGVALRAIADAHGLCPALLKLDKVQPGKPCFAHQVRRCRGACIGLETVAEHTDRLKDALASVAIAPWPFAGPIAFREGHRWHVLDGWAYLGMAADFDEARRLAIAQRLFDHDVYRLMARRIGAIDIVRLDR